MVDAFAQGAAIILDPVVLGAIVIAVAVGLVIGIMPAIGGMVAVVLFLPFLFRIPPEIALSFLVALNAVTYTGGSITAILVSIPGTAVNAATLIDGFPMTQKGEAGRAVGAAVTSSMAGGVLAVPMALLVIPLLVPLVMTLKAPEMFFMILLGLSFLAVLTTGSRVKGMISGVLGLIFATVGFHGLTGVARFTFDTMLLYDGINLLAVCLGLFALPELIDMFIKGQITIASEALKPKMSQTFKGVKDVLVYKWLWFRSTIIGFVVGVIPGVGGELATFMAYGQAKQTSKNPEKFGTGCVEGVIAPESANNAKDAGALLTTMAFGIPGSAVMAILLAGFTLVGLVPGPEMIRLHLPLCITLLLGIALANIIAGMICLSTAPYLIRVASINIDFLFPVVLILVCIGTFVARASPLIFLVLLFFGLLGFGMKRFGYSRPALLLGFVLGGPFEDYFYMAFKLHGPLFFLTPISLILIAIIIGLFVYPYLKKVFTHTEEEINQA